MQARPYRKTALVLSVLWLLFSIPAMAAAAAERHALVIGNAAYPEQPLTNTVNDADDLAAKLGKLGFDVTKHTNLGRRDLARAITDFVREVRGSDAVALFYYSGHGLQVGGKNYLVPVDARVRDELDVPNEAVPVDRLLAGLGDRGDDAVNLIILDACRNNPYKRSDQRAIGDKGLARVSAPSGTLILYATRPGATASDNPGGRNGLFTQHLLAAMDAPGVQVEETFKRVAGKVYRDSRKAQFPWQEGLILGRFYFVPPGVGPVSPPPPMALGHLQINLSADGEVWVDGRSVGKAGPGRPLNLTNLAAGRHRVEVRAEGGEPVAETAVVQAGRWTQLTLTPAPMVQDPQALEAALGLTRDERRAVQQALNTLGFGVGSADGFWGRNTRRGIERWQVAAGEPSTGYLDASGYKALLAEAAEHGPAPGQSFRDALRGGGEGPEMVVISAGSFQMGSNNGDDDEKPPHRVAISRAFAMGKHEVTLTEFRAFVQTTGHETDAEKGDRCWRYDGSDWHQKAEASWRNPGFDQHDRHPVVCVSWNDASAYAKWLSQQTGADYRLPTEAEWEYAARAGMTMDYWWGEAIGRNRANCDGCGSRWDDKGTAPVGSFLANPFGLHDTASNVSEWVFDWYDSDAYASHAANDPVVRQGGSYRVARGGSWNDAPRYLRSAGRDGYPPGFSFDYLGFRLARTL